MKDLSVSLFILLLPQVYSWVFGSQGIRKHSIEQLHSETSTSTTSLIAAAAATNQNEHESIPFLLSQDWTRSSRRQFIHSLTAATLVAVPVTAPSSSIAAVGSLPELANDNAILQGITIKVADKSQQDVMIQFLENGFECHVLRRRIRGSIEETWLGFGPEQLSIPDTFQAPVSSFSSYGGHASIHIVYDPTLTSPLYRIGDASAPGDNIAYLQLAVPEYRISQMVQAGGNIIDAYGNVNVISPNLVDYPLVVLLE